MKSFDVIVIGAGPGGYVAAIRAAQLGMKTAIVEKAKLGGMCLNWGCVPSRRMMESARFYERLKSAPEFGVEGIDPKVIGFNWGAAVREKDRIVQKLVGGVDYLMKKNQVEVIAGEAHIVGGTQVQVGGESYAAGRVIIATGSRPDREPVASAPQDRVVEIDDLFTRGQLPEKILVAGGGTVACEMASLLRLIGRTVVVAAPGEKLVGWLDGSCVSFIARRFERLGVKVYYTSRITTGDSEQVLVGGDLLDCDVIVNASDRRAVLPSMESMPLDLHDGFITINGYMQTTVPSVYAVGDVTGGNLAHVASAEAICAVNHIAGLREPFDTERIPATIYMDPEISMVGLTEEQVKERGIDYVKGEFPMSVNSKALVEGDSEGFVKILADQKYGEILGVHIVAARATEMIAEAVMCMRTEGTLDDLTRVIHPHPTVSETFLEAGFKAIGRPLHV